MQLGDVDRLEHIVAYCKSIRTATERFGNTFDALAADADYQASISLYILQIGELAGGLSEEFRKASAKDVPWREIRGMRNVVAHGYGTVSLDTLWGTVCNDVPELEKFCEKALAEERVITSRQPSDESKPPSAALNRAESAIRQGDGKMSRDSSVHSGRRKAP